MDSSDSTPPKPAVPKPAVPRPAVPKSAVPKPAVPKPLAPKAAVPKSAVPKAAVPKAAVPKPTPARPDAALRRPRGRPPGDGKNRRSRPTPVRQSLDQQIPDASETVPEILERSFTSDGSQWTVRIVGRAAGAHGSGPLPLLQVEFIAEGHSPPKSAVIVGTSLGAVSEEELIRTLGSARGPGRGQEP